MSDEETEKKKPWYKQSTLREAMGGEPQPKMTFKERVAEAENKKLAKSGFGGIKLEDGKLSRAGQSYDVAGARALVESAGELNSRITVTRMLATGPFSLALKKKKDDRQLFFTVTGPGYEFVAEVDVKKQMQARQFAAIINTAAGSATAEAPEPVAAVSAPDLGSQIASLAQLHAQGVLSDDEFANAKAKLLA